MKKDEGLFIEHILESINAIGKFSKNINKEELISNRMRQSAIIREIQIIGEAAKNLSKNLKEKHSEIAWKEIVGARDKMIHHYFGIDWNVVWKIIKQDIPDLKTKILNIRDELGDKINK